MYNEIFIRKAQPDDLQEIYKMMCLLENKKLDFDNFQAVFSSNLSDEKIIYSVAYNSIETIGFISVHINALLHHSGLIAEIQEFFIREDYRNLKLGKKLIKEVENQCILRGIREIEVTSNKKNTSAHRFYVNQEYAESHLKFTKRILPD